MMQASLVDQNMPYLVVGLFVIKSLLLFAVYSMGFKHFLLHILTCSCSYI